MYHLLQEAHCLVNKDERLIIDDIPLSGEKISFAVPDEWNGKEVMLMPFLNIHTSKVSKKTQLEKSKKIVELYWTDELKERKEGVSKGETAYLYMKTIGYDKGEIISLKLEDDEGLDVIPGQKTVTIEEAVNGQGEIWVEAYNYNK